MCVVIHSYCETVIDSACTSCESFNKCVDDSACAVEDTHIMWK